MALVKVYSPEGVEQEVETVDAREMMRYNGYTLEKPVPKAPEEAAPASDTKLPETPATPADGTPPAQPWAKPA